MKVFEKTSHFLIGFVMLLALIVMRCSTNKTTASQTTDSLTQVLAAKRITLPNGWMLTPVGKSLNLGDLPLNLALSNSRKLMAVTNNGQSKQTLQLIDTENDKMTDEIPIAKSWLGLAFNSTDTKLYASGGNDNAVVIYNVESQKLKRDTVIKLGENRTRISPAGLCLDEKRNRLYVVAKDDSSLYACDLTTREVLKKIKLTAEPYTCMLSPSGLELYISLWGSEKVLIFEAEKLQNTASIPTGSHPNSMVVSKSGKYLFVSNGNENSVSILDIQNRKSVETLNAALYPDAPAGSTPNAVALSEDEKTLFIANADNNCIAVFDVSNPGKSSSKGFIPVGWYPTAVQVIGKKIFVANGKGMSSSANPKGPSPLTRNTPAVQYIGGLFKGTLSIFDSPDEKTLASYSKLVYQNTPYSKIKEKNAEGEKGNPIPQKVGSPSPIKYVFYIIKENRTYDQVFGDMKEGNGDPSLCLFPEKITPNQHALAREFTLLDNFYVDAEVSADGHNWSTAAYANDYVEKNWVTSYGGRGGSYDYEGSRKIAYPKAGFIWDYCKRAGVSYRSYGEFTDFRETGKASIEALEGHTAKYYPNYNLDIKDVYREAQWERDFDSLLTINALPKFNTIRLGNDHTSGQRVGKATPQAAVADNDLAVGKFIEHLSQSKIWKESAVFILEDDAQNGADHVDAHRSPALVISPYTKRHFVDHAMYSTSGMLRTMELILGLPPMSQYDAAATPMWRSFTDKPDFTPFKALSAGTDIDAKNVAINESSRKSELFNLAVEDAAPDLEFNEVIWKAVKGENSRMPAPKRSAFVRLVAESEEED
ncbi:MAG: bifunctional YncE family protein/alkaline phosphatase family protein [Verrucomicrobia bacterium]|nr:bifunctional YncE family protein/alkaline phosphatase family protein [Cytophagales bacterium]